MNKILVCISLSSILLYSADDFIKYDTYEWHSWCGNACNPAKIFYPKTIEDIQQIIHHAKNNNIQVRFCGSGHSLNDLVCTKGYVVNTDSFNQLIEINLETSTVRVHGGMKLKTLFKILAKHDLALLNQGFIKEQSVAGALATGTHGTGKTGTLSDFIVSIELIDGLGNYRVISADSNPEWLEAARLNLGALGFVYAVTLQCVPLFVLSHKREMKPWTEILTDFNHYYHDNDYCMIMAHPISDQALVYTWNKTEEQPTNNFFIHLKEHLFSNEFTNYLTIQFAHIAPILTNKFIESLFRAMEENEHREYSYKTLSPVKNPLEIQDYIEEEIAIPIQHFATAIQDIFSLYQKYKNNDFELVGFMTCRFVKGSRKALLSPAYDQDSVYMSLITLSSFPGHKEFYQEYENLMNKYPFARSHWGKFNLMNKQKVAERWGKNLQKFNEVRNILDPHRLFMNHYLIERLG